MSNLIIAITIIVLSNASSIPLAFPGVPSTHEGAFIGHGTSFSIKAVKNTYRLQPTVSGEFLQHGASVEVTNGL